MDDLSPTEVRLLLLFRGLVNYQQAATVAFISELSQPIAVPVATIDHVRPYSLAMTRH